MHFSLQLEKRYINKTNLSITIMKERDMRQLVAKTLCSTTTTYECMKKKSFLGSSVTHT